MKVCEWINLLKQLPETTDLTFVTKMENGEIHNLIPLHLDYVEEVSEGILVFDVLG